MTDENNNIMVEDEPFDTTSPDAEAVGKFLSEAANNSSSAEQSNIKPIEEGNGIKRIEFGADNTFSDEKASEQFTAYGDMTVNIQDDQHAITEQEKEDYLRAMLTQDIFTMDIKMSNGLTITCRDLNVYEKEVATQALASQLLGINQASPQYAIMVLRRLRMPMQIQAVNGKPFSSVMFEYTQDNSNIQEDIKALEDKSNAVYYKYPNALYSLLVKALNVFENKLTRLENAAFNQDFWKPVGHDL